MKLSALDLSQDLLLAVKKGSKTKELRLQLAELDEDGLAQELSTDEKRIVFWVNVYNAFIQLIITEQPHIHANKRSFYTSKLIPIAHTSISFDDIEHGILRKRKFKYGLGYLPSFFDSAFVKRHQVLALDYRIHFALNCGAKSCPPIAFYSENQLAHELDLASSSFLLGETEYIEQENVVWVTKLMLWFLGDFGGRTGILEVLKKYQVIPKDSRPKIRFQTYNWDLSLNNYK